MTLVAQGQKSYSRNSVWNKAHHLSKSSLHKKHEKVLPSIKNYTDHPHPPIPQDWDLSLPFIFFHFFLQCSPHPPAVRAFCKGCTREFKVPTRGWGTVIFPASKKAESQILLTSESSKAILMRPLCMRTGGSRSKPAPFLPINHDKSSPWRHSPMLAGVSETMQDGI